MIPGDEEQKIILISDDDADDFLLIKDAFAECCSDVRLDWTRDGEETLAYLAEAVKKGERPSIVFLDLNMPKINGREVLRTMRNSSALNHIPVVVLTNSSNEEDALTAYRMGVNSFVRKPAGYAELKQFIRTFYDYWFTFSKIF